MRAGPSSGAVLCGWSLPIPCRGGWLFGEFVCLSFSSWDFLSSPVLETRWVKVTGEWLPAGAQHFSTRLTLAEGTLVGAHRALGSQPLRNMLKSRH